jgi:hypothetical protein
MIRSLCTARPRLNDVWTNQLISFLLPNDNEMNKKRFIVRFELNHVFPDSLSPSDHRRISKISRPSYLQPGVILCRDIFTDSRAVCVRQFYICFTLQNASICCQMGLNIRDYKDDCQKIWRSLYNTGRGGHTTLDEDNGQIWYYHEYEHHVFEAELPQEELSAFCTHHQRCLLMHAVRHKVRTLRHVE